MDVTDQLHALKRMPFSAIMTLPTSSSEERVDSEGRRFQVTTWCEPIASDKYQVVVSLHLMGRLGSSRLCHAEGFVLDASGRIELLSPEQVSNLFV
jgi:hypothetical protein